MKTIQIILLCLFLILVNFMCFLSFRHYIVNHEHYSVYIEGHYEYNESRNGISSEEYVEGHYKTSSTLGWFYIIPSFYYMLFGNIFLFYFLVTKVFKRLSDSFPKMFIIVNLILSPLSLIIWLIDVWFIIF